ncbi:MAG: gliding motility lipoprotein GldH [Paramuribaculum sp.]|nr:gliding motility lipoprotein GldH [Paramuribaculum sp.]
MTNKLLLTAVLAAIITACTPIGYYSEYKDIEPKGWAYSDTLCFNTDTCVAQDMVIAVRHSDFYRYKNIWVEISDSTHTDSVNIVFCDMFGRWLGKGIGASYQISVPVPFTIEPNAQVRVRHILRIDTVKGIEQIGLVPQE